MIKKILPLALASSCFTPQAFSEQARFGGPDAVPNQLEEDSKSWNDWKKGLAADGLSFTVDYSAVGFKADSSTEGADDNSAGGMVRFYGQWDAINQGQKNTGSLIWKVEHRHDYTDTAPKSFLFGAGALGLEVPPFSDEGGRLTNLYWKQRLNDNRATVMAGFMDVTDFLDVYALASPWTGFSNFAFSTGTTTVALPGDATLGAAGATMLGDEFFVIGSLADMESDPTRPFEGFDTFFNNRNYFKSVEFGWTASQGKIYTDNIHLTYWHADESKMQGTKKGQGLNFSASRLFGQWLPFFRAGVSEDAGTLTEKSISLGTGYFGLGGPNNNFGAGLNWAEIDGAKDQYTTEVYYLIKVMDQLEVTPNIQWIKNPALNPSESDLWVAGLRGRVAF